MRDWKPKPHQFSGKSAPGCWAVDHTLYVLHYNFLSHQHPELSVPGLTVWRGSSSAVPAAFLVILLNNIVFIMIHFSYQARYVLLKCSPNDEEKRRRLKKQCNSQHNPIQQSLLLLLLLLFFCLGRFFVLYFGFQVRLKSDF